MQATPFQPEALMQAKSCGYIRGVMPLPAARTGELVDHIKRWIIREARIREEQVVLIPYDKTTTLTNGRNYPGTNYKENIVKILIISTDEQMIAHVKATLYGTGTAKQPDVVVDEIDRPLQIIESANLFKTDLTSILLPPKILDTKTPTFTIQCTDLEAKVQHLIQFMIRFGVRDADAQSIGVHTTLKDPRSQNLDRNGNGE